ncbi:MAG: ATP-binding cassette domain-containing protein [Bacteroidetes bacterium]|nr:ATP-binding cassette domain-containing protein [Bacteroidota bacterium]
MQKRHYGDGSEENADDDCPCKRNYHGPRQKKEEELAEVFGIGNFLNMRVQKMSSGMRQKVSLARTMVHDPPMLILDEPTTGLDVITLKHVISFILRNKAEGKCILFSSHTMSEVEAVCDEVIFMHKGSIIAKGTREHLLATYRKTALEEVFLYLIRGNGEIL